MGDGVPENLLDVEACGLFGEFPAGNSMIYLTFFFFLNAPVLKQYFFFKKFY